MFFESARVSNKLKDFLESNSGMQLSYLFHTQAFVTIFLTGLIWFIQLVHYPSFLDIGAGEFSNFHTNHTERISLIVVPMMTLELVIGIVLLFACFFEQLEIHLGIRSNLLNGRASSIREMGWLVLINLIFVIMIWFATFMLSVPIHNRLATRMDMHSIELLISTNWIRTIIWSIKVYIVLRILVLYYRNPSPMNFQ